jgi:hypothetical protein
VGRIHMFDINHSEYLPKTNVMIENLARCGYTGSRITIDVKAVTCKRCLREINKDKINSMEH